MKAEELMIGDWVRVPSELNRYKMIRSTFDMDSAPLYRPIPLTVELLKANGFNKNEGWGTSKEYPTYVWGKEAKRNFTIVSVTFYEGLSNGVKFLVKIETDCSHDSGINSIHHCDIEYVHQLQHAVRLCGIDNEIILNPEP